MTDGRRRTDVVVVGAGPAGAAAARVLAAEGCAVTIVDKAAFPRDKCCGDGLTSLALRELDAIGFDPLAVASWTRVDAAWLRSPSGREVCLPLRGAGQFAAVTPRVELDDALVGHARRAGAQILDGHAFTGVVEQAATGVVVAIEGIGEIRCRYVVAADGMWSPVRKALELSTPGYLGEWYGLRQYATGVTGPARARLYVWFDTDLLPGYAWSFPLPDGRVNIGFGVLRDAGRKGAQLRSLWPDLLQRPHIRAALGGDVVMQGRHSAWPIPAGIDRATLASERVLFVGDAAMATDSLTGEGIGQALLTGRLAAQAIIAGGAATPATVRERYERSVRAELFADHKMSVLLGRILATDRGARGAVRAAGLNDWTRRNFARWMFEDEPRAIALTPKRWHRRMFRRDGAFVPGR